MSGFSRFNGAHCGFAKVPQKDSNQSSKYLGQFATYEACLNAALQDPSSGSFYSIVYHNTDGGGWARNCHAIITPNDTTFLRDPGMICGLKCGRNDFLNEPNNFLNILSLNCPTACPTCPPGPTACPRCPTCPTCPIGYTGPTGPCNSSSNIPYIIGISVVGGIAIILFIILLIKIFKKSS